MFKVWLILLLVISSKISAQVEERSAWSHCVGGGVQFPVSDKDKNAVDTYIKYKTPSVNLFYRFLYTKDESRYKAFTLHANYRSGYIREIRRGILIADTTEGNFESVRLCGEINNFWALQKNSPTFIGFGIYGGGLVYGSGNFDAYGLSAFNGYYHFVNTKTVYDVLNRAYFGLSLEVSSQLEMTPTATLMFGLRAQVESREAPDAQIGKCLTLFTAYRFWRQKKGNQVISPK